MYYRYLMCFLRFFDYSYKTPVDSVFDLQKKKEAKKKINNVLSYCPIL